MLNVSGGVRGCILLARQQDRIKKKGRGRRQSDIHGVAGLDGGMGGDGRAVLMTRHVWSGVVVEVDPAVIGGRVRPDDAVGRVGPTDGAWVIAFILEAVDVDVADVRVGGGEGGEAQGQKGGRGNHDGSDGVFGNE